MQLGKTDLIRWSDGRDSYRHIASDEKIDTDSTDNTNSRYDTHITG